MSADGDWYPHAKALRELASIFEDDGVIVATRAPKMLTDAAHRIDYLESKLGEVIDERDKAYERLGIL